jgi:hypothetical protein
MIITNNELKSALFKNMELYQDRYKMWQKHVLKNIEYLKAMDFACLENISYCLNDEFFEEGKVIAKSQERIFKLYILTDG